VLDEAGEFPARCNAELVDLESPAGDDLAEVRALVEEHRGRTDSPVAERVLRDWESLAGAWVKVMPRDYKRALAERTERARDIAGLHGERSAHRRHLAHDHDETAVAGVAPDGQGMGGDG
jgi:glutamate synthase domain-containing protein 3